MQETKIHILTTCTSCQGKAYLPAGRTTSCSGEPYTRFTPCSTCEGSGREARWISLPEFLQLIAPYLENFALCEDENLAAGKTRTVRENKQSYGETEMATTSTPKTDSLYTESPVSWNTRYITPEGFECQLTLRGETGQEVLEKANNALSYLLKVGCQPAVYNKGFSRKPSSNGGEKGSNGNSSNQGNTQTNNNGHNPNWCSIHNCEMKKWEKDGRVWYSHKVDGDWCTGKEK